MVGQNHIADCGAHGGVARGRRQERTCTQAGNTGLGGTSSEADGEANTTQVCKKEGFDLLVTQMVLHAALD